MGMIIYHKITAEITGPDGREWLVSIEPPAKEQKPGEVWVKWDATIRRLFTREELEQLGGVEPEPITYQVPSDEGMFKALNLALDLVPRT